MKETATYISQFSGGKTKVINHHGEEMKFRKGALEDAKGTIGTIKKEVNEANSLFNKSSADLSYDENAVDNTVLKTLKTQMETIKKSLDEQKKSLETTKDALVQAQRTMAETSSNLTSKKVEHERLTRSYSIFKNNPPKTDEEAQEAKKLEDKLTMVNKEISALESKLNAENTTVTDLQAQTGQMSTAIDSTMNEYQTTVSSIRGEELAIYKKQQVEIKVLLDNSIDTLKSIIQDKNAIVVKLDNSLKEISQVIKDQTQKATEDNSDLEALQKQRMGAITQLTKVNSGLQQVAIQAQEHLKNSYAIQLKILGASETYYTQEKNLLTTTMTDIQNQITAHTTEITTLEIQKGTLRA